MSDIEQDDGDAPVDRIDQMQSEAKESKLVVYVGSVALVCFVGAFLYLQFGDDSGPSNPSIIPAATETPAERPTGRDLFGDVDFAVDEPEPTPTPVEDPRIADLAQQVADATSLGGRRTGASGCNRLGARASRREQQSRQSSSSQAHYWSGQVERWDCAT